MRINVFYTYATYNILVSRMKVSTVKTDNNEETSPKRANNEMDKYLKKCCYKTQYLGHDTTSTCNNLRQQS
jgi:hypothetical protein